MSIAQPIVFVKSKKSRLNINITNFKYIPINRLQRNVFDHSTMILDMAYKTRFTNDTIGDNFIRRIIPSKLGLTIYDN